MGGDKGLMIILKLEYSWEHPPQVHRSISRLFHALGVKGLNMIIKEKTVPLYIRGTILLHSISKGAILVTFSSVRLLLYELFYTTHWHFCMLALWKFLICIRIGYASNMLFINGLYCLCSGSTVRINLPLLQ